MFCVFILSNLWSLKHFFYKTKIELGLDPIMVLWKHILKNEIRLEVVFKKNNFTEKSSNKAECNM